MCVDECDCGGEMCGPPKDISFESGPLCLKGCRSYCRTFASFRELNAQMLNKNVTLQSDKNMFDQ